MSPFLRTSTSRVPDILCRTPTDRKLLANPTRRALLAGQPLQKPETATAKPRKPRIGDVLRALRQPKIAIMLALGFSSGLPFFLTANTLGYWMRDEGLTLKAIGFLSWVGLAYSLQVPLVAADRPARRAVARQTAGTAAGVDPDRADRDRRRACWPWPCSDRSTASWPSGWRPSTVAFASATQDIVVDAWRIEAADTNEELGLLSSAYQLGYRIAVITSDALILFAASHLGWPISYVLMALLMVVGIAATLKATEPAGADEVLHEKSAEAPLWTAQGAVRRGGRTVPRLLQDLGVGGPPDAGVHQPLPAAGVRHGADGDPLLPRPRALEGHGGRRARPRWASPPPSSASRPAGCWWPAPATCGR